MKAGNLVDVFLPTKFKLKSLVMFIVKSLKEGCVRRVYHLAKQMKSTWGIFVKQNTTTMQ